MCRERQSVHTFLSWQLWTVICLPWKISRAGPDVMRAWQLAPKGAGLRMDRLACRNREEHSDWIVKRKDAFFPLGLWNATVELYKALLKAGGLIRRELLSPTLGCAWRLPFPSSSSSKRGYQGHPFASWPNTHGASRSKPVVSSWSKLPSLKNHPYFDPRKYI